MLTHKLFLNIVYNKKGKGKAIKKLNKRKFTKKYNSQGDKNGFRFKIYTMF